MKKNRISWTPSGGYRPNSPYSGDDPRYIFRGLNQIVTGNGDVLFTQSWKGYEDISETVAATTLTGTAAITNGVATVTGTSTVFLQELIVGSAILINNQLYQVRNIASNTSMTVSPAPAASGSGYAIKIPHILMDVDISRVSLARGSVQRFPQGTLLAVGQGVVKVNGAGLTAPGLTATKRLQIAMYNPGTGAYSYTKLGMLTPTLTTVAATGGGTKNMQAGVYSVRIVPVRLSTGGYNNPSNKVEVTLATGDKIRITFPAMDTTGGQDAWDIYGSLFSGSGIQGPWYFIERITTASVSAAGGSTYDVEYTDAEIAGSTLLSFNNDAPPDAAFVASLQGYPILLSCNGPGRKLDGTVIRTSGNATVAGTSTTFLTDIQRGQIVYINNDYYEVIAIASDTSMTVSPTPNATDGAGVVIRLGDTAPGPVIRPSKPNNPDAYPAELRVAVSPPENIIGYVEGNGRLFCMTENRLHMVTLSGNQVSPITTRPFWRAGFRNPQGLVFVNGRLYGYTSYGPTRSIADGDEGSMEFTWAADVANEFQNFTPERVSVGYDPVNEAVCYFHSNDSVNGSGYYTTKVLMYMLRYDVWSTPIVIESTSANMTVSGVATVSGQLYFIANEKIYKWHSGTSQVTGYIATPFVDLGQDGLDKTIRSIAVTGYSTSSMAAGVWAAQVQESVPIVDIQNGTNSDSGSLTFAMSTAGADTQPVRQTEVKRIFVPRARLFSVRCSLASTNPNLARLDEILLDYTSRSNRY